MFKKFGVPVVQVGKSFELSEEEKKKLEATPEDVKKENENVFEKR